MLRKVGNFIARHVAAWLEELGKQADMTGFIGPFGW